MKNLIIILIVIIISATANAQSATTKGGYFACTSEAYLSDIFKFAAAKDTASGDAYISSNKCVILKAGLTVSIMEVTWSGKIQFTYQGLKMWTVKEAINL